MTVTSTIEGCHATLKSYLQRGHGDLMGVFLKLKLFWTVQHTAIETTTAQQKLRLKHSTNIPLFAAIMQNVHGYILQKILQEYTKLPTKGPPNLVCLYTVQTSIGIPCYYTIWERKQASGVIQLGDIHHHWYYSRPNPSTLPTPAIPLPLPLLNPLVVKGKGCPRGALGGVSRVPISSTRQDPLLFEIPSSSAPAILDRPSTPPEQLFIVPSRLSSTAIAMARLQLGHKDLYEPGTQRERGYMQSMASVYQTDSTIDPIEAAAQEIQRDIIGGIEVYTQVAEYNLTR